MRILLLLAGILILAISLAFNAVLGLKHYTQLDGNWGAAIVAAVVAIISAIAVAKNATPWLSWEVKNLDAMDAVKIRLKTTKEQLGIRDSNGLFPVAIIHLTTGQFIFAHEIHDIGYQAASLSGTFAKSPDDLIDPLKGAVFMTVRYTSISTVSI